MNRGGERVYFLCLEETGVGRKSYKIDGIVSTVLSGVVARNISGTISLVKHACLRVRVRVRSISCTLIMLCPEAHPRIVHIRKYTRRVTIAICKPHSAIARFKNTAFRKSDN